MAGYEPFSNTISLAHGDGGELTHQLITGVFLKYFHHDALQPLNDAALIPGPPCRLALTTDSFVVKPLFFPGGNIGTLAVNGTVNDLAVSGARPLYLTVGLILEEGLPLPVLEKVIAALAAAAQEAGVAIVAGDTKVVERGHGDQIFINTTGLGLVADNIHLGCHRVRPGDAIICSGAIGDHGLAVLAARENFGLKGLKSDCAALHTLILPLLENFPGAIKWLRDPTRGGLATTVKELALSAQVDVILSEEAIPVHDSVRGGAEILGLDYLYLANEGKFCAVVESSAAEEILAFLRRHPLGCEAALIGEIKDGSGRALLRTTLGATRELYLLSGQQLPRIC
ncbi:Hydrogenase expression/formation protein HypE [Moorella glycerini]|uniref:Hydrogenase isoenzymes formation protein HypE n=1 Tax=Neomoorella stamsii TaxID=1266720 RepID=A0A9X7J6J1_9FIRM|nr:MULTISPECIES: hydrogenase expression/formation protein HypE [Moorella]PRR77594.1 Hydrogenase isoenzymes formation protein HypE [Moorella stamsii]CEP69359.1 Hydrogenase expression/formation protein HypE [Moorella glycerini]